MGLIESTVTRPSWFQPGAIFTIVGSRNTPYMRTKTGYVDLVTEEEYVIERGDQEKEAKPLSPSQIRSKYALSAVQYDAWLEHVEKKIKPRYI